MRNFIIRHKTRITLMLLIFLVVVFLVSRRNTPTSEPQPTPTNSWQDLRPGQSTKEEIESSLGLAVKAEGDNFFYKSESNTREHEVFFENDSASLVKRVVVLSENISTQSLVKTYGSRYQILYGEDAEGGNQLFVYLDKGVAFLGNPVAGGVLEIWYFEPLSPLEAFITKYAQDYSREFEHNEEFVNPPF